MKKEIILKLLKSPVYEDVILGLNYIRDWNWEQIKDLRDVEWSHMDHIVVRPERRGDVYKDVYILNKEIHCHYNGCINFYKTELNPRHEDLDYIQL